MRTFAFPERITLGGGITTTAARKSVNAAIKKAARTGQSTIDTPVLAIVGVDVVLKSIQFVRWQQGARGSGATKKHFPPAVHSAHTWPTIPATPKGLVECVENLPSKSALTDSNAFAELTADWLTARPAIVNGQVIAVCDSRIEPETIVFESAGFRAELEKLAVASGTQTVMVQYQTAARAARTAIIAAETALETKIPVFDSAGFEGNPRQPKRPVTAPKKPSRSVTSSESTQASEPETEVTATVTGNVPSIDADTENKTVVGAESDDDDLFDQ